jgi:hypothetical protein
MPWGEPAKANSTVQVQSKKKPRVIFDLDVDRSLDFLPPDHHQEGSHASKADTIFPERLTAALAPFSRCPNCKSYALYRRNNIGTYECQTCGQGGITEVIARARPA